jgi:hypothetical protein
MTWFPLQAALKMSTLPGAIRATLDALLDHINPAPEDPTRPDTLTVWESRARLAAETGFSEVTTRDHLQRLRGEADLRKGQRVMVLKCTEDARSHRAARYELLPAALDALVDPARLEAFEARTPRGTHPYHRWRQWRASQMAPAAVGESTLPQAEDDGSLGVSALPQAEAVGVSSFPQLGQASSPELPEVDQYKKELTTTDAPAAPLAHAPDKAEAASPFWCPDCGYAIPSCIHRTRYRVQLRQEVTRPAPVWGGRLAVHPASP